MSIKHPRVYVAFLLLSVLIASTRANASVYNAIRFGTEPSNTMPSAAISPAPTVELVDQFGNLVSSASDLISISLFVAGGSTLSGTLTEPTVSGIATFSNLSINLPGSYELEAFASATGFSVPSNSFTVFAAPNPTPLPAALPLFATGLGALGLVGWRRKRKARAVA